MLESAGNNLLSRTVTACEVAAAHQCVGELMDRCQWRRPIPLTTAVA